MAELYSMKCSCCAISIWHIRYICIDKAPDGRAYRNYEATLNSVVSVVSGVCSCSLSSPDSVHRQESINEQIQLKH